MLANTTKTTVDGLHPLNMPFSAAMCRLMVLGLRRLNMQNRAILQGNKLEAPTGIEPVYEVLQTSA